MYLLPSFLALVFFFVGSVQTLGWLVGGSVVGFGAGVAWQLVDRRDVVRRMLTWCVVLVLLWVVALIIYYLRPELLVQRTVMPSIFTYLAGLAVGTLLTEFYLQQRDALPLTDSPHEQRRERHRVAADLLPSTQLSRSPIVRSAPHGDAAKFIDGEISATELMRRLRRRNGLPDRRDDEWSSRVKHELREGTPFVHDTER